MAKFATPSAANAALVCSKWALYNGTIVAVATVQSTRKASKNVSMFNKSCFPISFSLSGNIVPRHINKQTLWVLSVFMAVTLPIIPGRFSLPGDLFDVLQTLKRWAEFAALVSVCVLVKNKLIDCYHLSSIDVAFGKSDKSVIAIMRIVFLLSLSLSLGYKKTKNVGLLFSLWMTSPALASSAILQRPNQNCLIPKNLNKNKIIHLRKQQHLTLCDCCLEVYVIEVHCL